MTKKERREYYARNAEKIRAQKSKWRKKNPVRCREIEARRNKKLRTRTLFAYSNGKMRCACCGERHFEFLSLDHIKGGGSKDREVNGRGNDFYQYLRNNNYPPGLQVLCMNCNFAKGKFGGCPHNKKQLCEKS